MLPSSWETRQKTKLAQVLQGTPEEPRVTLQVRAAALSPGDGVGGGRGSVPELLETCGPSDPGVVSSSEEAQGEGWALLSEALALHRGRRQGQPWGSSERARLVLGSQPLGVC